jgi:hypothetical protein
MGRCRRVLISVALCVAAESRATPPPAGLSRAASAQRCQDLAGEWQAR